MNLSFNVKSLIEIRGSMKLVQLLLAILTFATATSGYFKHEFTHHCISTDKTTHLSVNVQYPYNLSPESGCQTIPKCPKPGPPTPPASPTEMESPDNIKETLDDVSRLESKLNDEDNEVCMVFNYNSSSQFYVFVGVMSFLYTLSCVVYMVMFEVDSSHINFNHHQVVFYITDIFSSFFFFGFGLIGCISFMVVTSGLKSQSDKAYLIGQYPDLCTDITTAYCTETSTFNHATFVMSILFSLVHSAVYGASLGMMWRDRVWRPAVPIDNQYNGDLRTDADPYSPQQPGSFLSGPNTPKAGQGFMFEHNDTTSLQ